MSASLDFPSRPAAPRKTGLRSGPRRIASAIFGASALFAAAPASAVTLDNGVVLITQADALAGNVTPSDTPGFPVTLSVSGSYRFASNLLVSTAVNGIEPTAPEVTIDFAGFRMAGSGVGQFGIIGFVRALTVNNGTIRGFTKDAIYSGGTGLTVDRMRIVDNLNTRLGGAAITSAAENALIRNSNVSRNGDKSGIICTSHFRIENNIIVGQGSGAGMVITEAGGIVIGNTVSGLLRPIQAISSVSIGDNTFVGNTGASQGAILALDPNQPPPP